MMRNEFLRGKRKKLRKAGILHVAAEAGVSPATVSRYFNHPELVRLDTRARIQAAATALGYVRNRAAGSLNRGRSGTIGMVVPTVDNAIFAELIQTFTASLDGYEHALLIASHGYDLAREAEQVQVLLEHQADGIVLVGGAHAEETFRLLEDNDCPALTVWNWHPGARLPCIGIDNCELGRMAAEHLAAYGHRDIACLFPDSAGNDRAADRRRGALDNLNTRGTPVLPTRQISCPYDIDAAKAIVCNILKTQPRPTAILAGNDIIASAAVFGAMALGQRIPNDISIIGIGDFRSSRGLEPGLTTIRIPAHDIATHAAEAIVQMVNNTTPPDTISRRLQPELIIRASTARLS